MSETLTRLETAKDALDEFDIRWYARLNPRWMDLIGDYAGTELFALDGDAVCQVVLDDPLLAFGNQDDNAFQLLHLYHAFEYILFNFVKRNAVFDVVFFEENQFATAKWGESELLVASRTLARSILKRHLKSLNITAHTFESLEDEAWNDYVGFKRPMFFMTNDGGVIDSAQEPNLRAERALAQRHFVFRVLTSGITVASLRAIEFKNSKIMSFVYEAEESSGARVPSGVQGVYHSALETLRAEQPPASGLLTASSTQSQATWLTQACKRAVSRSKTKSPVLSSIVFVFLLHAAILPSLSIEDRAQRPVKLDPKLQSYLSETALPVLFLEMDKALSDGEFRPDLDGRVFLRLLELVTSTAPSYDSLSKAVGEQAFKIAEEWWAALGVGARPALEPLSQNFHSNPSPVTDGVATAPFAVLPFQHPVLDKHLSPIHVTVDTTAEADLANAALNGNGHLDFGNGTVFTDDRHWHNQKAILPAHQGGAPKKPENAWQRNRQLRSDQRFMSSLQRQAITLTGAKGARLEQQVITPVGARPDTPTRAAKVRSPTKQAAKGKGKHGKEGKLKSADKIRLQIMSEKEAKSKSESEVWWKEQMQNIAKMPTVEDQITQVEIIMRGKRMEDDWLAVEVAFFRLHLECTQWIADPRREHRKTRERYTISLLRQIKDMYDLSALSKPMAAQVSILLGTLGFENFTPPPDDGTDRALSFKFVKLASRSKGTPLYRFFHIDEDPVQFQLRSFGEYMDRSMDSQPDPRVQFSPDKWQRDVLDRLDRKESVLVVAPTSAGKTFISYYAMEQVLRESDEGCLVYVAPTKALVTQIAAEVYARFRKDLNGRSCWAIHTRDFRIHDPQKTQILVTVPEMLSIMLLSPPLARVWTPRIKRIIFDEIHTIGQEDGGNVYEQLILLAPCPIIGLSATVGNPEQFNDWLASVQAAHGYKHSLIQHKHRYSHLRKYVYQSQKSPEPLSNLEKPIAEENMKFIHPVSTLSFGAASLPDDFSLESRDCLSLYEAMKACAGNTESLEPRKFFAKKASTFLQQKDILEYEAALKGVLSEWMTKPDSRDPGSSYQKVIAALSTEAQQQVGPAASKSRVKEDFDDNLINLLKELHQTDNLPAILFSFDRNLCEVAAESVINSLEKAEQEWRETSPEWKRKIDEYKRWHTLAKTREREAAARAKKKTKGGEDRDDARDAGDNKAMETDAGPPNNFDPDQPSPEFSFASQRTTYSLQELKSDLRDLGRWGAVPDWALRGLERGVAVHHSGMNKRYRTLVESLFRIGYLRVVIATGTLALGINMPCKTAVFMRDSPFLTALMFRQCAGRAGRRGFDLLGKVVFFEIPTHRLYRLVLSRIPPLTGQFPLTTTLCLRLFNLLHGSENAPVAVQAIQGLLDLPRLSVDSDTGREEVLHHLRWSVDYLRRARLLDADGSPLNLFGIAAHLYYAEPGNLALVALLRSGAIHKLCEKFETNKLDTMAEMMLILSHLFDRRYLPRFAKDGKTLETVTKKYPSRVVLAPLPKKIQRVVRQHNEEILQIFSSYAITYASQYAERLGPDNVLPLSKAKITPSDSAYDAPFREYLRGRAVKVAARSSFVANSGHGDVFGSVDELTRTARSALHLNKHAIPALDTIAEDEGAVALNAVFLDFFTHGQVSSLVHANGIRRGDVWYALQNFYLILLTVQQGLEQLLSKAGSADPDAEGGDLDDSLAPPDIDEDRKEKDEFVNSTKGGDGVSPMFPTKPASVSVQDWRVYETIVATTNTFGEKFKAMWA